jgi:hypothetical protein
LLTWFPPLLLLEGTTDLARKGQKVSWRPTLETNRNESRTWRVRGTDRSCWSNRYEYSFLFYTSRSKKSLAVQEVETSPAETEPRFVLRSRRWDQREQVSTALPYSPEVIRACGSTTHITVDNRLKTRCCDRQRSEEKRDFDSKIYKIKLLQKGFN